MERQRRDGRIQALLDQAACQGVTVHLTDRAELDRLSGGARHQGVVARVALPSQRWSEADVGAAGGSGGIGAVAGPRWRTGPAQPGSLPSSAAAAGVHAVIAPADRVAGLTATVRKVACGAAEIVPFVPVTNLARALRALREQGIWVIGAAGEAGGESV